MAFLSGLSGIFLPERTLLQSWPLFVLPPHLVTAFAESPHHDPTEPLGCLMEIKFKLGPLESTKPDAATVGQTQTSENPIAEFDDEPLTEDQEESLQMAHQAILECIEMDVPGEALLFSLMQIAAEFALSEGYTKSEFLRGAGLLFEDSYQTALIERASDLRPIEE
jgi:hypothetical protein